jgi:hypothetical protein
MMETLHFVFMGFLGGFLYALFWSKKWRDMVSFEAVRHMICGCIIGYIYSILHSVYNYPNLIMGFVAGWMGVDFIQGLVERFGKR